MGEEWDYKSMLAVGAPIAGLAGLAIWYANRLVFGPNEGPPPGAMMLPPIQPPQGGQVNAQVQPGPPPIQPPPQLYAPARPAAGMGNLHDELIRGAGARRIRMNARLRAAVGVAGDLGHIAARHGPDVTHAELCDRLLTGLDREGVPAPTAGVSSRFVSDEALVNTVDTVLLRVEAALDRTRNMLAPNLLQFAQAEQWLGDIQGLLALPGAIVAGPKINEAHQKRRDALKDLQDALGTTNGDGALGPNPMLPVYWSIARQRIELNEQYVFVHYHGNNVGEGFYGTQAKPAVLVQGVAPEGVGMQREMVLYGNAVEYAGPLDETVTVLDVAGQADRALGRAHSVRQWTIVTHYPTGQIAGGDQLKRGFSYYSGVA